MDARRRIIKILRAVLYVFACMVAVILTYMLIKVAYNTALNTMSVSMITEDAFARRAQSVLLPTSTDEVILARLFSQNAIATDNVMNSDVYDEYVVLDYYERVDIDTTIVWAWEETANIRLTEVMRDLTVEPPEPDENGNIPEQFVPQWPTGIYDVTLVKEADGSWQIDSLTYVEYVNTEIEEAVEEGEDTEVDENAVVVDGEITTDETQSEQEQSTVSSS